MTLYFDWSMNKGLAVVDDEGGVEDVRSFRSIDALLDTLDAPTTLVSEATFESFNTDRRASLVDRVNREGHEWWVIPTRQTPRARAALDLGKDDSNDTLAIRHVATTRPSGLKRPTVTTPVTPKADAANDELMRLRREYTTIDANTKIGFKVVKHKDEYAKAIIASHLPPFKTLTETQKTAFGTAGNYALPLVAAAAKATKHADSRKDFESITGLFASGYPSQIRSDVHHWRWRFVRKAMEEGRTEGISLSDFRREVRWMYHQLDKARSEL